PLLPLYVSTVDSGNLAGHLLTLKSGLLALPDEPIIKPQFFEGIQHTVGVLMEFAGTIPIPRLTQLRTAVEAARCDAPATFSETRSCLERLAAITKEVADQIDEAAGADVNWWACALARQCRDALEDLTS